MTPEERSQLLDALIEGDMSEADFLRIEAELSIDPKVRQEYYRRLQLEALLEQEAELPAPPYSSKRVDRKFSLMGILPVIAVAALFCGFGYLLWSMRTSPIEENPKQESLANGFAILSGQSNAIWNSEAMAVGSLIPTGDLHLVSGSVHLELFSGVQMVIEGEARFSIDSPMQVTLQSGRARATVPKPARGFRVKTSSGDVIDLGTEFSLETNARETNVHVVDGEIECDSPTTLKQKVQAGHSVRLTKGTLEKLEAQPIGIPSPEEFQNQLARRQSGQFERWRETSAELQRDPRLIAYYQPDPERGWSRQLKNLAVNSSASDGAIVAAKKAEDRWGRTRGALDFSSVGSRVRMQIPGEYESLTLMCWVKIHSLDRWYNSLFLTDGHEDREPHWQIMDDGRIFFSVKPPEVNGVRPARHIFFSPNFWKPSLSGRWIMLCTTYDAEKRVVTHFLNGEVLSTEEIPNHSHVEKIRIGAASLGNWSEPIYRTDPTFVVRNLNGSLDEFALFSEALSQDDIQKLYQRGNPHEQ